MSDFGAQDPGFACVQRAAPLGAYGSNVSTTEAGVDFERSHRFLTHGTRRPPWPPGVVACRRQRSVDRPAHGGRGLLHPRCQRWHHLPEPGAAGPLDGPVRVRRLCLCVGLGRLPRHGMPARHPVLDPAIHSRVSHAGRSRWLARLPRWKSVGVLHSRHGGGRFGGRGRLRAHRPHLGLLHRSIYDREPDAPDLPGRRRTGFRHRAPSTGSTSRWCLASSVTHSSFLPSPAPSTSLEACSRQM